MGNRSGSYNVVTDFSQSEDTGYLSTDVYWVIAVVRLGTPLSFSRRTMKSVTTDLTEGALLRADKPLVITDDCISLQIQNSKRSHTKSMSATLLQTATNYLIEILPGDHVMAWIVNNKSDFDSLLSDLDKGKPCNQFNSGLKFVGRVHTVGKTIQRDRSTGMTAAHCELQCTGFNELNTHLFFDNSLASKLQVGDSIGSWLATLGLNIEDLFAQAASGGVPENNVNQIIPTLLDLVVGKGPPSGKNASAGVDTIAAGVASAMPQTLSEAPYSYVIPSMVGQLLNKQPSDASKPGGIMAYADILELTMGVQNYSNKTDDTFQIFVPDLSRASTAQRNITTTPMLGTFLPFMPQWTNRPLWGVFQQFLNPTVNELYTCLRANSDGFIVPQIVARQIPFTTDAFTPDASVPGATSSGGSIPYTRFLDLPRWVIPDTMLDRVSVSRSDAMRMNFIHIYGSTADQQNSVSVQYQLINNPPIRDDLDIQRSGMHPYMTTVECFVNDQVGSTPGQWMKLVADWTIGAHLALTGTISSDGIQAPICEGDNIECDGVVYHIEGVSHSASIDGEGRKNWTTTMSVTNGMRAETSGDDTASLHPIYPGFEKDDNTRYDPGFTLEQRATTGADSVKSQLKDDSTLIPIKDPSGGSFA